MAAKDVRLRTDARERMLRGNGDRLATSTGGVLPGRGADIHPDNDVAALRPQRHPDRIGESVPIRRHAISSIDMTFSTGRQVSTAFRMRW
jgi:hypothetical protein